MTTIKYLRQIERYDRLIKNKTMEIERLEETIKNVPALPYDKEKIISSGSQERMADDVIRLLDTKAEFQQLLELYTSKRKHIIEQIESIPDNRYMIVLSLIYLEHKELWQIPNEMPYTYSYARNLHSRALKAFERRYGHEYLKSDKM